MIGGKAVSVIAICDVYNFYYTKAAWKEQKETRKGPVMAHFLSVEQQKRKLLKMKMVQQLFSIHSFRSFHCLGDRWVLRHFETFFQNFISSSWSFPNLDIKKTRSRSIQMLVVGKIGSAQWLEHAS